MSNRRRLRPRLRRAAEDPAGNPEPVMYGGDRSGGS